MCHANLNTMYYPFEKHSKPQVFPYMLVGTNMSRKSADLIKEFKRVYDEEGKFNLSAQVPYLAQLAEIYQEDGSDDPVDRWTSILKVTMIFLTLQETLIISTCWVNKAWYYVQHKHGC